MKSVPILHTTRCVLSAITSADIPVLRQIMDDTYTQHFLPELCEVFQTEDSLKQFIASFDTYLQQDEGFLWGIHKEDTFIGFIAIMDIPDNPTLFYAMHPIYRNRGYMKESLKTVIDYTKGMSLCNKLQTEVYQDNKESLSILESCGFKEHLTITNKVFWKHTER